MGKTARSGRASFLFAIFHLLSEGKNSVFAAHVALMVGEARIRGCGLPRYTRKVVLVLQRRMKDFAHTLHL
jgi:hypothetical protein